MGKNPEEPADLIEVAELVEEEAEAVAPIIDAEPLPAAAEIPEDADPGVALLRLVDNAVAGGMSIEVIERLLVVHERYEAGLARKEFNAAMAALRAELPAIVKTEEVNYKAKGGQVFYLHENLARIVEDLSPVMARHGLAFRWATDATMPESISVTCIVTHAAGHSETATLFGPPDLTGSKNAIQAIASTVSYLQRYTLKAVIGIAAGKDDDGQGGAASQEPMQQPKATGQPEGTPANGGPGSVQQVDELHQVRALFPADQTNTISANQVGRLRNLAKKNGWSVEGVDDEVARVLSLPLSEIPAIGDAYEATVRWFQTNKPQA